MRKAFRNAPPGRGVTPRDRRLNIARRIARWIENERGRTANQSRRLDRRNPAVEALTGWQRNQWARAGYPKDVASFAAMVRA